MTHLHQIAERVINRPLLIHPDKAAVIMDVLSGRLGNVSLGSDQLPTGPEADRFFGSRRRADGYAYSAAQDGVAVITIVGSLVNRGAWIGANSGAVSYEGIKAQLAEAARDPEVKSIVLDIDSPGGEALGMASLAGYVRRINAEKPVVAVVNDMAASAAYGIASAASRIFVSKTSVTGSIGVVMMHADRSAELEAAGVAVTLIYAGAHKVDGHPFGALPDTVKADLQAEVAKHYAIFTDLVGEGRGDRLTSDAARKTEARVFFGAEAIEHGIADEVGDFDEIVADLAASSAPTGGLQSRGRHNMSTQETTPAIEPKTTTTEATQADVDRARAEGAAAERTRIKSILTCAEAQGREAQAQTIALETDMTSEQAAPVLAAAPQAVQASSEQKPLTIAERAAQEASAGGTPMGGHPAKREAPNPQSVYQERRKQNQKG